MRVIWCYIDHSARGRQLLNGVGDFNRNHQAHWQLPAVRMITPNSLIDLPDRDCVGVITGVNHPALIDWVLTHDIPAVTTSAAPAMPGIASVVCDDLTIGHLAANELFAAGHHQFGYVGQADASWSQDRLLGFSQVLRAQGCAVHELQLTHIPSQRERLDDFLRPLPKPIGVMCCNDMTARVLLERCRYLNLPVPDQLAVIGVDNDHHLCEFDEPTISSVDTNHAVIGFEAATRLQQMLETGRLSRDERLTVRPAEVVIRASSSPCPVDDPTVRSALAFIHDHLAEPISVTAVADAAATSRRRLELRFRDVMNRTVAQQIRVARLRHAQRLLATTREPMSRIAFQAGYRDQHQFARQFRQQTGTTPTDYRRGCQAAIPQ